MKKDYLAKMRQLTPHATPGNLLSRNPIKALSQLEKYFYANITHNKRIVLIIDYAETVVPNTDISRYTDEDRYCLVTLNRWANDPIFTQGDVSILLLTENLADLNPTIVRSPSAIKVNIPIPDETVRASFLQLPRQRRASCSWRSRLTVPEFAAITSGLNLMNLNQLAAESFQEDRQINLSYLKEKKKQIIEAEAVGLLEFIESEHDLVRRLGPRVREEALPQRRKGHPRGPPRRPAHGLPHLGPGGHGQELHGHRLHGGDRHPHREVPQLPLQVAGRHGEQPGEDASTSSRPCRPSA